MFDKVEVNGEGRHPLYAQLTQTPDAAGRRRRRAVELREVPRRHRRHGARPHPAQGRAGVRRGRRLITATCRVSPPAGTAARNCVGQMNGGRSMGRPVSTEGAPVSDQTPTVDHKPRSRDVTDGIEKAASRGMLRAVGMGDDDWVKSQVGVASSWNEITPCNLSLKRLARRSGTACSRPAATRWSSAPSRSPTASRWATRACTSRWCRARSSPTRSRW